MEGRLIRCRWIGWGIGGETGSLMTRIIEEFHTIQKGWYLEISWKSPVNKSLNNSYNGINTKSLSSNPLLFLITTAITITKKLQSIEIFTITISQKHREHKRY